MTNDGKTVLSILGILCVSISTGFLCNSVALAFLTFGCLCLASVLVSFKVK